MSAFRTKKGLAPIKINAATWMYAERSGLTVVRDVFIYTDTYVKTETFCIPWAKVRRAVSERPRLRKCRAPSPERESGG